MDFYTMLSRYYDALFPADGAEIDFVAQRLVGARRVLDIGCGTGHKTVRWAAPGRRIEAIDDTPAMIARAESEHGAPGVAYRVLDMRAVGQTYPAGSFDAVVCLGNTLAHLTGPGEMESMVEAVARRLVPGGVFVVQIVNFDRVLDRGIDELPKIEGDGAMLRRRYGWREGAFRFRTELRVRGDGEVYRGDIPMRPIRRSVLDRVLRGTGWESVAYNGHFSGAALTADSFHLIATARRPASMGGTTA